MLKGFEEFQKVGKDGFDAAVRSFGEMNKGFQAIAAEVTDYSKKAFQDSTRAYDTYVAEMSKLGDVYVGLAKDAYKPVEAAFNKKLV